MGSVRKVIVFMIVAAVAVLAGCGSSKKEIEQLRADQEKELSQVRKQTEALAAEMRRVRGDINELDADLFELRGQLDLALTGSGRAERAEAEALSATTTAEAEGETAAEGATAEEVPVELIEADLETLAVELTKMRDEVAELREEYDSDKELAELRDPRKTWEAMGDSTELSKRLDRFAGKHAATIEEEATREQFVADVKALQEQVAARANMATDEQVEHYHARLTERINAETNDRMRRFYEQQLNALASDDADAVERQLDRSMLFDNSRGVGEIAEKYSIPSETLRDNGLQSFGGFGGGRRGGGGGRGRGR